MKRLFTFLITALVVPAAFGQEAADNRLGVYEAVELAYASSPLLNQLQARLRGVEGQRWTSFGVASPRLVYLREGIEGGGFAEQRWGISQSFDFPLQSYYRLRQVDATGEALILQLGAERRTVKAAVKRAYTDLLHAQELIHLRQEEVRLGRQLQEAAQTRVEVGEASELDLMKAELQLAEARSNLEDAQRRFQNARYTLFNAVGLDPEDQRYEIRFPDTLAYVPVRLAQADVLGRLSVQPALLSAERRIDAARLGTRSTRSALLPNIQIDYYPQDFGSGYRAHGFQVGFTVPLWAFAEHRGAMQQARAEVQQASWNRQGVFLDLKKEVEQAWHSFETSEQTIRRYHEVVRGRAEELLRLTLEGYRLGEVDLITLLDTQRTYLASQQRYYDALRDYYHHLIDLERFLDRDLVFGPVPAGLPASSTSLR